MSCPCLKREYYFLLRSGFCGLIALLLAACASTGLPQGEDAYANFPSSSQSAVASEYRIGPLDVLTITVFQEPDLSAEEVPVDASGHLLLPDRTSVVYGKGVSVRLDLGGRPHIKQKK